MAYTLVPACAYITMYKDEYATIREIFDGKSSRGLSVAVKGVIATQKYNFRIKIGNLLILWH